jgi:hypothetical protein
MSMLNLPHIRLTEELGRVVVHVDDQELLDLVEDFLCEQCGLEFEFLQAEAGTRMHLAMAFPDGIDRETVERALI